MKKQVSIFLNVLFSLHIFLAFLVVFEHFLQIPYWLQPLGRMHPLLLHFPVAFVALLLLLHLFKKFLGEAVYRKTNYLLLLLTSLTTVLATLMGLLLSLEGYDSEQVFIHKWIGIALSFIIYAAVLLYQNKTIYSVLLYLGFAGVVVGGHNGAALTHGSNFLTEPITAAKQPKVDENTPLYTAYIAPILSKKCTSCHNPQKTKGALDLTSIEGIQKGGESGEVWVAHRPEESLLLQRIALPLENEEHMPPEGKTQLTKEEVELLTEWIAHGSNPTVSYALLAENDTLRHIIGKNWLKSSKEQPTYAFNFAGSELIEKLNGPYRTVVQKSPDSPALDVSIFGRGTFKKEFLTELSQVKEQVVYLNLSNLPVDNNLLQSISNLNNLEHLVLNFTDISKGSTSILTNNNKLSSLSLAGTAIDFSDLQKLKQLKNLKELFVWNTKVSDAELTLLQEEMPSVSINEGYIPNPEEQLNLTPPVLLGEKNIIKTGATISLTHKMNGVQIRYTLDGSEPDENATLYEGDIVLDLEGKRSKTIKAIAYKEEWLPSEVASFEFFDQGLKPEQLEVTFPGVLSAYTGRAEEILNDDLKNDANTYYYSKHWASFREKPLEAIADFGNSNTGISEIILSCGLRPNQKESTIDFVSVWTSNDKENWQLLKRLNLTNETNLSQLKKVSLKFPKSTNRYFKIVGQPKKNQLLRANQLFFF